MPGWGGGLEAAGAGEPPLQGFSFLRSARGAVNDYNKRSNQRSCYLTDSVDSLLDGLERVRV